MGEMKRIVKLAISCAQKVVYEKDDQEKSMVEASIYTTAADTLSFFVKGGEDIALKYVQKARQILLSEEERKESMEEASCVNLARSIALDILYLRLIEEKGEGEGSYNNLFLQMLCKCFKFCKLYKESNIENSTTCSMIPSLIKLAKNETIIPCLREFLFPFFYKLGFIIPCAITSSLLGELTRNGQVGGSQTGQILIEGQLYSLAQKALSRQKIFLQGNGIDLLEHHIDSLYIQVQVKPPNDLSSPLQELNQISHSLEEEEKKHDNKDWLLSTCYLALCEGYHKCGAIWESLQYAKNIPKICKTVLKKKKKSQERNYAEKWLIRMSFSLNLIGNLYHRLGDRKRSYEYCQAAIQALKQSLDTSTCANRRIMEYRRSFIRIKSLYFLEGEDKDTTMIKDVNENEKENDLMIQDFDLCDFSFSGIEHDDCDVRLALSYHEKLNYLQDLIYRGDISSITSNRTQQHQQVSFYEKADMEYNLLVNSNILSTVSSMLMMNKTTTSIISSPQEDSPLEKLYCTLQLRRLPSLPCPLSSSKEEIYEKIKTSSYATSIDRADAIYRIALEKISEARNNGELYERWKGNFSFCGGQQPIHHSSNFSTENNIEHAIDLLKEALIYAGPPTNPLSRNIHRQLALAQGPSQESAMLIHTSIGATARQQQSQSLCFDGNESILKAFDSPFPEPLSFFSVADEILPLNWNVVAMTICPTGELVLASLYASKTGSLESKMACIFPSSSSSSCGINDSSSAEKIILNPLTEILKKSHSQLFGSFENDTEDQRRDWWTKRQDTNDDLQNLLKTVEQTYFSGDVVQDVLGVNEGLSNTGLSNHDGKDNQKKDSIVEEDAEEPLIISANNLASKFEAACTLTAEEVSIDHQQEQNEDSSDEIISKFKSSCTLTSNTEGGGLHTPPKLQSKTTSNFSPPFFDRDTMTSTLQKKTVVLLKKELEEQYGVEKKIFRRLRKAELIQLLVDEKEREFYDEHKKTSMIDSDSDSDSDSFVTAFSTITQTQPQPQPPVQVQEEVENESTIIQTDSPLCDDNTQDTDSSQEKVKTNNNTEDPCLFLVLDENLHKFPWEGLDILSKKCVCRVSSLPFILLSLQELEQQKAHEDTINNSYIIEPHKVNYILDPESNLSQTRRTLEPVIKEYSDSFSSGWSGYIGEIPPPSSLKRLSEPNSLFLYCGHGGGECCFSKSQIHKMNREIRASVILMGCSSASLHSFSRSSAAAGATIQQQQKEQYYEPDGVILSYLNAGSPGVVGNLWDVTDRDIDRYCINLLELFFKEAEKGESEGVVGMSLPQCVAKARNSCKMKYMVGCAPVYYGIPVRCAAPSRRERIEKGI